MEQCSASHSLLGQAGLVLLTTWLSRSTKPAEITNNNSHQLLSTHYLAGTVSRAFHALSHLVFTTIQWGWHYFHFHLTREETELRDFFLLKIIQQINNRAGIEPKQCNSKATFHLWFTREDCYHTGRIPSWRLGYIISFFRLQHCADSTK